MVRKSKKELNWHKAQKNKPIRKPSIKQSQQEYIASNQSQPQIIKSIPSIYDRQDYKNLQNFLNSKQIFGREKERATIQQFLTSPQPYLISVYGNPGLGKTCLVLEIIRNYEPSSILTLNGLKLLQKQIKIDYFPYHLIIIDEFDRVDNKKQCLIKMRKMFPCIKIILISNEKPQNQNLKLPQPAQILIFFQYKYEQLVRVTKSKLSHFGVDFFNDKILQYIGKRVASQNGDFRKMQNILKQLYMKATQTYEDGQIVINSQDLKGIHISKTIECLLYNTPKQHAMWKKILQLSQQQASRTDCNCFGLTTQRLSKRKIGLTEQQIRLSISQWVEMKLLKIRKKECNLHHKYLYHVELRIQKTILTNTLLEYDYFN